MNCNKNQSHSTMFNNLNKDITVSFNLCSNQQVLSWGYSVQNNCQNKTGYYFWGYDTLKQKFGVENLALAPNYLNPNSCTPCSCDSVLFFPELNLCSKLTIVLLTQNNRPLQEYEYDIGITYLYPGVQIDTEFAPKIIPNGNTICNFKLSDRSKYNIWRAIICSPFQCSQKVEFELVAEFSCWELFDTTYEGLTYNDYVFTDLGRVENIISKYLD